MWLLVKIEFKIGKDVKRWRLEVTKINGFPFRLLGQDTLQQNLR